MQFLSHTGHISSSTAEQREKPAGGMACTSSNQLGLDARFSPCSISAPFPGGKKLLSLVLGKKQGQGLQSLSQQVHGKYRETAVRRSSRRAGRAQSPWNQATEEDLPARVQSNQH